MIFVKSNMTAPVLQVKKGRGPPAGASPVGPSHHHVDHGQKGGVRKKGVRIVLNNNYSALKRKRLFIEAGWFFTNSVLRYAVELAIRP